MRTQTAGTVAEQLAEPNRDRRRDRLALAQDVIEMLARNTQKPRNLRLAPSGRRNDVFPQQSTRMRRTAGRIALGGMKP